MATIWVYGARDSRTRSGAPFYFMHHLALLADRAGYRVAPIPLARIREQPWTFARWALRRRSLSTGRYLFTQTYHDASFARSRVKVNAGDIVVSFTQILPGALRQREDITLYSYFDVTLSQFCAHFRPSRRGEASLTEEILATEKKVYPKFKRQFVYTHETKNALISNYGVSPDKIEVLGRGANLPIDLGARISVSAGEKLDLMIVGADAARKGMHTVIKAIDSLPPANRDCLSLTIAGPSRWTVPRRPYIRALGFIGPSRRHVLLMRMANADLGVLLSTADALPSSTFEFISLGVPIWITDLPGMREAFAGYPVYFETLPVEPEHVRSRLLSWTERPTLLRDAPRADAARIATLSWASRAARVLACIETQAKISTKLPAFPSEQLFDHRM